MSQGRRRQVKKLTRMKETLADNISSLFKTAAGEIARKDAQNKELSARCARPARLRRRALALRCRLLAGPATTHMPTSLASTSSFP